VNEEKIAFVPTFTVYRVNLHIIFVNDGFLWVFESINFAFSVNLKTEFYMEFDMLKFRHNWAKLSYSSIHFSKRRFCPGLFTTLNVHGTLLKFVVTTDRILNHEKMISRCFFSNLNLKINHINSSKAIVSSDRFSLQTFSARTTSDFSHCKRSSRARIVSCEAGAFVQLSKLLQRLSY
jgi:hypothetical protein